MKYTITVTLLTWLLCGLAGTSAAAEPKSMSKLLKEAKIDAFRVSRDALILKSFMRQPKLDWRSHASQIDRMKNDVNAAGQTAGKLNDARVDAADWQIKVVDSIIPLLRQIADNTNGAIDFLNKNQSRILITRDYKDFIEANAELSRQLSDLVGHYVDYSGTRGKYEDTTRTLRTR